jgi:hypothetical protein
MKSIVKVLLIAAASLLAVPAAAQIPMNQSLYPARVAAIRFSGGLHLSYEAPATFGSWTVRFPSQTAVARYQPSMMSTINPGRATLAAIHITLRCSNAVAGASDCLMVIIPDRLCILQTSATDVASGFQIDCPTSLEFAR